MKRIHKFVLAVLACPLAGALPATAADPPSDISVDRHGRAMRGWDATAYISRSAPAEGVDRYTVRWRGAVWRFASRADRDRFTANPERFAPQFGGHCANGLSEGHLVSGDPQVWMIVDGRLYLFHLPRGRRIWSRASDLRPLIARARANWTQLRPSARR